MAVWSRCGEERVPREVIESKLLAALDDEGKVAIVASERDLDVLIRALSFGENSLSVSDREEFAAFRADLVQLREAAFS